MSIKAETSFSLKDQLFNADTVGELAGAIKQVYPRFKRKPFETSVVKAFPELELKQRISRIVDGLDEYLPAGFEEAAEILEASLPPPLDPTKTDDDFGKFIWIVPGEYVARHGCSERHLARSLDFLREATKRFSSEGAIRPFLKQFNEPSMAFIHTCTQDDNYHVRRLASEGIRPFLPWAPRADVEIDDIIAVLDQLFADQTRYVTRSVANTLNDISRIEPQLVVRTLKRWRRSKAQTADEMQWVTRHALRTLLKEDEPDALALLGYAAKPKFKVDGITTTGKVSVGESFDWHCELQSLAAQRLKVTMKIYFLKANGTHSPKVFAVKDAEFAKGEVLEIRKSQSFKPITTRVMYPGAHHAELIVNGVVVEKRQFELQA